LQRIEAVEIAYTTSQREGRSDEAFVVDVYYKQSQRCRIRVVSSSAICSRPSATATSSTHAPPDVQVERTFREIRRLRDAVYYAASNDHGIMPCAYCTTIFDFILLRSTTPSTISQWFQTKSTTCASLTAFMGQLVQLAAQVKTAGRDSCCCYGQQRIPKLLSAFLELPTSEDPST
jgi:hypothetical protein